MDNVPDRRGGREFTTTHWSLVLATRPDDAGGRTLARRALAELCRTYWYPLYAFVRLRGYGPEPAQDLTQAFFAYLLETSGLEGADPDKGRFRSYLLGAMKHFLANHWHRARARKRGGDVCFVDLDALEPEARYSLAAAVVEDPDLRFDRDWAVTTLDEARRRLQAEYERKGQGELFAELEGSLTGEEPDRRQIAERLGLTDGAVKVAVHRLRRRLRDSIRAQIAETVDEPAEIEQEMRHLLAVLRQQ